MGKSTHKMILALNYSKYVLDESVAIELFKLLNQSESIEIMDSKWNSESKTSTNYVRNLQADIELRLMPAGEYAVLKLAAAALEENKND